MLNRFIDNLEYSSRFRILKGGKISLVVSALLLATTANAYNITISDSPTTCAGAIGRVITAVADCNILASDVTSALGSGNLEINTGGDGNITLQSEISWSTNTFTLTATNGNFLVGFAKEGTFAGKATISDTGAISINGDSYTVITDRTALETVATGGKYVLGNTINLSESNWTPLAGFYGVFDGLGNTVTNMTIDGSSGNFIGLFAGTGVHPNGAHFRNVGIIGANITNGGNQVGALAGNLDYGGSVKNSYSTGTIVSAGQSIGGLVGNIYSATPSASIINSFSTASITGISSVGGLIGTNNGTISNSYARGSVTATVANGDPKAGGFVGSNNNGTISNSYSTGLVTKASGSTSVGGFVGDNLGGTITNSFWDTTTSGTTVKIGSTQGTSVTLVGKTTAQMKTVATYTATTPSWNITGSDGEYPTLNIGATTWIIYGNAVPTLTTISNLTGILEGFEQEITFDSIKNSSDANDTDGTVTSFVVKAVSGGTLKIGTSPSTATSWGATINDTIDATHQAYWTPASSGTNVNAFTVVVKDDAGAQSTTPLQVKVDGIASRIVTGTITSGYDFTDTDSSSYPKANLLLSDGSSINVTTGSAIKAEYLDIGVSVNGSIIADDFTIEITSISGMPNNIINYGNITASGTNATAIKTNSGTSIITNGGTITGNVILADGEDDTFNVLAGSVVNGYVDAGTSANSDPVAQYLVLNSSSDTLGTNQVLSTEVGTLASAPWNFDLSTVGVDKTYRNFESVYTNDSNITFVGSGDINAILDLYEGGTLKVGDTNSSISTGILQTKGLNLDPEYGVAGTVASKVIFDLNGTMAGTQYDQIDVNGTVDITNSDLNISLLSGFSANVNDTFVLIKNDGTDPITGTFNSLDESATIVSGKYTFSISYIGGENGNDVVLTLTDIANSTPTAITLSSYTVRENDINTTVATLSAIDADISDTHTFSFKSIDEVTDNNLFTIDGTSFKLKNPANFESKSSYKVSLKVVDALGASFNDIVTINVIDVNESIASVCGTANSTFVTAKPTLNLCGTSNVSGTVTFDGTHYNWNCNGATVGVHTVQPVSCNATLQTYTVTIVDDTNSTHTITSGDTYTTEPTKEGYIFSGWYTNANLTTQFNPSQTAITSNTTLYPKWVKEITNSVTLLVNTQSYGQREVTIETISGLSISNTTNNPNLTVVGRNMSLPFGSFAFNISGGANGFTAPMSIIVDKDVGSFTYYKQNNSGKWTNITKTVALIDNGKAKIYFDLVDGGVFDRDGIANGTIVDPGGVATNKLNPYVIEGETLVGDVSFVEDSTSFMGTLAYNITGGKDKELFTLNSTTGELSFKNAPVYSTTSSNAYIVEVTASGTTSGSEARAITVTVLNSDGANTVTPIVIGACGSSNRLNLLTAPTSNLCQSGIASSVTQANNLFNWSCNSEDVAVVNCSANKVLPVVISDNSSGVSSNTTTTDTEYTTTVTDSSTNSVQATKFISGDKKAEHIAKANGVAVSTATSYVEGTQINVKSSGDVETTVEMLDDSNSTVSIKVEGKVTGDEKAVHSLSVGGKETKATSKVNGTTTTISAVGEVETKATVGAKEITAQAFADGKATHIIKIGNVESKATIEFAGAQTVMENDGSVKTSVDETQTINGNPVTVKSVVATDNQGETQTWFEDSNGNTLERTVSQSTPLESGATIDVTNDSNGKLQFKIVTPVTREIVIE